MPLERLPQRAATSSWSAPHAALALLLGLAAVALVSACADDASLPSESAVRDTVRGYVEDRSRQLTYENPTNGEVVQLTFQRMHEEVRSTDGGRQVVCVDFTDAEGAPYDVDFYVDARGGELVVEESVVHKIDDVVVLEPRKEGELDDQP